MTNELTVKNCPAGGRQDQPEMAEASALLDALLANCLDYIYFRNRQSRFIRYTGAGATLQLPLQPASNP